MPHELSVMLSVRRGNSSFNVLENGNLYVYHFTPSVRLGEEKESAERNLEEERRRYEEQILQLVDQQEEILREREGKQV